MKTALNFFWLILLVLLAIHGAFVVRNEWKTRFVHKNGEIIEVKIEDLDCGRKIMSFNFATNLVEKKIDARTCALLNRGQTIRLKHSPAYSDLFLFINEHHSNSFLSGGLEIAVGIIGLLANLPIVAFRKAKQKRFFEAP